MLLIAITKKNNLTPQFPAKCLFISTLTVHENLVCASYTTTQTNKRTELNFNNLHWDDAKFHEDSYVPIMCMHVHKNLAAEENDKIW